MEGSVLLKAEPAIVRQEPPCDRAETDTDRERVRVAMLLWNPCTHDSRVIKEAETLASAGYEVRVFCLAAPGVPSVEERNDVTYIRYPRCRSLFKLAVAALGRNGAKPASAPQLPGTDTTASIQPTEDNFVRRVFSALRYAAGKVHRALGSPFGKPFRHAQAFATLGVHALAYKPAVVHAHDLITLWAGAMVAERAKAKLIYDTHEYALNVSNAPKGMSRLQDWLHERYGIRRANAVITVSRSIAGSLRKDYRIPTPKVIYNAPVAKGSFWANHLRSDLRMERDVPLVVYVGGLARNRGIETVVSALQFMQGFHLASVGPANAEYEARLREQAKRERTSDRLHFLKPVPSEALIAYLRSADVGVIAYQNVCLNHEFCMPNKLFECALAGVPLAVSNLRDLRRFVTRNKIGVVMDETDARSIAEAIRMVYERQGVFRATGQRLEDLALLYGWETQAARLAGLYKSVLAPRSAPA